MVGANFNYQFIDWGHDKIPNSATSIINLLIGDMIRFQIQMKNLTILEHLVLKYLHPTLPLVLQIGGI